MYTEKSTKCPFCKTPYSEFEKNAKKEKGTTKPRKESFKIWKDN